MTGRVGRSLKASAKGIDQANKAVLMFATKLDLAAELEISRTTVQKFFAGKPVQRENFHKICQKLELPWQDIAELPNDSTESEQTDNVEIDSLVQTVRKQGRNSLRQQCGIIRVLDMPQPVKLLDIYTSTSILEKISGQRWLELADFLKRCDSVKPDRLGNVRQDRVLGITAVQKYSKLMVLGKPGVGKTTFLKYIALQCNLGTLHAQLVARFISLKDFAERRELNLFQYIGEQLSICGIANAQVVTHQLLSQGKMLILLDGLDEVQDADQSRVLRDVRHFVAQFYDNRFIVSCRLAAQEYTFEQFTEVEIANFDQIQINVFATRWFAGRESAKGHKFIQKLRGVPPILELANCPILVTLLCLVFEESSSFPTNRPELYQEGLDILLKKWDAKRDIERGQVYQQLSTQHKRNLLGRIARITFEQGNYFFKQQELEQYISDYLQNFSWASTEPETLYLDSQAVLKSIEVHHGLLVERARGIYSFSHLTFQEYFTAQAIVMSESPQTLQLALKQLSGRVTETRWREIFLLSVQMLSSADYLLQLMKQQIDQLVAQDSQVQAFLTWFNNKATSVAASYKPEVVRAFYLDLALAQSPVEGNSSLALARTLNSTLTRNLDRPLALDLALDRALSLGRVVKQVPDPSRVVSSVLERAVIHSRTIDNQLERSLQQLKQQLPVNDQDTEIFKVWWRADGQAWAEQLTAVVIEYRNLGQNWRWNVQQQETLRQYYKANQLLVECLHSSFYVSRTVRTEIEATLLLSILESEQVKESQVF